MRCILLRLSCLLILLGGCVDHQDSQAEQKPSFQQQGKASYYARHFHGQETANGETFDQNELVAAHKTLPFGSLVQVTNLNNDKEVTVRINDRGPFKPGRVIDLSRAAARQLGMTKEGVAPVRIERVE